MAIWATVLFYGPSKRSPGTTLRSHVQQRLCEFGLRLQGSREFSHCSLLVHGDVIDSRFKQTYVVPSARYFNCVGNPDSWCQVRVPMPMAYDLLGVRPLHTGLCHLLRVPANDCTGKIVAALVSGGYPIPWSVRTPDQLWSYLSATGCRAGRLDHRGVRSAGAAPGADPVGSHDGRPGPQR